MTVSFSFFHDEFVRTPSAKARNWIFPSSRSPITVAASPRGWSQQYPVCLLACLSPDKDDKYIQWARAETTASRPTPGTITIKNNDFCTNAYNVHYVERKSRIT